MYRCFADRQNQMYPNLPTGPKFCAAYLQSGLCVYIIALNRTVTVQHWLSMS